VSDKDTDALTSAVANWVGSAGLQLDGHQAILFYNCIADPHADLHVHVALCSGVIQLRGVKDGNFVVLYEQNVEPIRPATPLAIAPTHAGMVRD